MLIIDGSYGEGGGQILRTSVALASIFKKEIKIINIRKKRDPPGLKKQHLHAINLLSRITKAKVEGLYLGSTELYFKPLGIFGGEYEENIGTAGSITLLLQAVLLPSLFADSKIKLKIIGGTDVKHSPSFDYFRYVILPYFQKIAKIDIKLVRRGFYPKGGGIVEIDIKPEKTLDDVKLLHFNISLQKIDKVTIYSVATNDLKNRRVAERMARSAKEVLSKYLEYKIEERIEYVNAYSTGAVITIVANSEYPFGVDVLGQKRKTSEEVGKEAARKFLEIINTGSTVDINLADNLIPLLALSNGYFYTNKITGHLETNIWVVEKFLGKKFKIEKINRVYKIKTI